jgi:uncharacterized membrane protein YhaH (DUF805 family)
MNFPGAIKVGFSKYSNFRGRATRSEFWYWVLFTSFVYLGLNVFISGFGLSLFAGAVAMAIMDLLLLLPSVAITARRLHDTNRSGWWQGIGVALYIGILVLPGVANRQLTGILPVVAFIALIVFLTKASDPMPNRFDLNVTGIAHPERRT